MCLHFLFLPKVLIINLENAPVFQFPHICKNNYHIFKQCVHILENALYFMLLLHMFGKYLEPRKENLRYPTPSQGRSYIHYAKMYVHVFFAIKHSFVCNQTQKFLRLNVIDLAFKVSTQLLLQVTVKIVLFFN